MLTRQPLPEPSLSEDRQNPLESDASGSLDTAPRRGARFTETVAGWLQAPSERIIRDRYPDAGAAALITVWVCGQGGTDAVGAWAFRSCDTPAMWICRGARIAGLALLSVSVAGCIGDVRVIGAMGVTVDEQQRPVLIVEACQGTAAEVRMSFDREGLADNEQNEDVGIWVATEPASGSSKLALHAPAGPWTGDPVELASDRGYIVDGIGEGDGGVLSQVYFRGRDIASMDPGMVYTNNAQGYDLVGRSAEDFTSETCSRP